MREKASQREQAKRELREDQFKEMVEVCLQAPSKEEAYCTCVDNYFDSKHDFDQAWRYAMNKMEVETQRRIRSRAESVVWKPWQQKLEAYLLNNHDDRRVDCVLDKNGNTGKSFFVSNFIARNPNNAIEVMQGKTENMSAQIANAPFEVKNTFIDLTRFQQENANLTFVEGLKNAVVHNHKYQVFSRHYEHPPNIVVMTNKELEWSHMTLDRWHIWELNREADGTVTCVERDVTSDAGVTLDREYVNGVEVVPGTRKRKAMDITDFGERLAKLQKRFEHKMYKQDHVTVDFEPRPCTRHDDNESECTHL